MSLIRIGHPRIALIGQPNCGKSTLFNGVAGYRSETGNFPGSTVQLARGLVKLNGAVAELVDVPGIYSLTTSNPAESAARQFLLNDPIDLIINVVDASLLSRSLELTLELRELGIPMVVCLNMLDEAERKGASISIEKLSQALQVPVVATVASRGVGVRELFVEVRRVLGMPLAAAGPELTWDRDIEQDLRTLQSLLDDKPFGSLPPRFLAIKLLEREEEMAPRVSAEVRGVAQRIRERLSQTRGRSAEAVIMAARHDVAMRLDHLVVQHGHPRSDARVKLDALLTHPFWGYVMLAAIFIGFFWVVFGAGAALEQHLQGLLAGVYQRITPALTPGTLGETLVRGVWDGFVGGAAIVLPFLVPFLIGLALLEDLGYLPRVAYLMDGLLHRIGLHGTSMLPLILGYGCSVPACLATRILPSRRDRFLASVMATLVPCSARSNVIFALVAFYLGPLWALGVFVVNALIVIVSGWLLTRAWPEVSPGMILEVPRYQLPHPAVIFRKVWLRLREFVVLSWPILVGGSVVLALAEFYHVDRWVNLALSPLTAALGLPLIVGTTLVFGVLRKELSIVMLVQALGTSDVTSMMTTAQILVFTLFVTFYMPCLATFAVMVKELGRKLSALAVAYTFALATVLGVVTRFGLAWMGR